MIEVFKKTEDGLKRISEFEKDSWINVSYPGNVVAKEGKEVS